jgi:hypothetical protein
VSSLGFDQKLGSGRGKNKDSGHSQAASSARHSASKTRVNALQAVGTVEFGGFSPH